MRYATIRTEFGTTAARVDGDVLVPLAAGDVGEMLAGGADGLELARAGAKPVPIDEADFAPLVTHPGKVICVGLNYRAHIMETGREAPEYPTLFAKFADTLLGPHDDLVIPSISERVDWEVELGVVIGTSVYRASVQEAEAAIAGYTVINDVSMRDWQRRTTQFLQGKMFERSTPVGPYLVTAGEIATPPDLEVRCEVDGVVMQQSRTSDLLFGVAEIVAYASQAVTLRPGDLIATGTPGGVGDARKPPVYLQPGNVMRTWIEGIGECVNHCVAEKTGLAGARGWGAGVPTVRFALAEGVQRRCRREAERRGFSDDGEAVRAAFFNEDGSRSEQEHYTARNAVIVAVRRDCLAEHWLREVGQAEKVVALTHALAIVLALPNAGPVPAAEARHRTIALWALRRRIQEENLGGMIGQECRELGAKIGFPDSAPDVTWFTPGKMSRALMGLRTAVHGLRIAAIGNALGRLRPFGRPGQWVLDPDPWVPDPAPPTADEAAVLASLLTVYTTQFGSYTTLLWQVPALSLTAQAFLLTIVLANGNGHIAKLIAAVLSIVIALASTRLMHDQRGHAMNHGELALRISKQLGLGRKLGSLKIEDAEPAGADAETVWASWDHRIYHTWTTALYLFFLVDVAVLVPTIYELFQHHY